VVVEQPLSAVIATQRPSTHAAPAAQRPVGLPALHALPWPNGVQVPATQTSSSGHRPVGTEGEQASGAVGPTQAPSTQVCHAGQLPFGTDAEHVVPTDWQTPLRHDSPAGHQPAGSAAEQGGGSR
jgi:hypothetical protein